MCEKSDGVRCLLYCTEGDAGQESYYLIDRKNDYYWLRPNSFHVPRAPEQLPDKSYGKIIWDSFHTNTILDGELLFDVEPNGDRTLKYLVFDCLFVDGQNLMQRTLDKRLAYFNDKIHSPYKALCRTYPSDTKDFAFQMEDKKFQFSYAIHALFNDIIPKLKHGSDGLILTCRETPYKFGTDENILKWKPAEENTVDFRLSMEFPPLDDLRSRTLSNGQGSRPASAPREAVWDRDYDALPKFTLYVNQGETHPHLPYAKMYATVPEWDFMKKYATSRNDGLEGAIVESHKDSEGRWRFNRFREDKPEANYESVVHKVVESIEDGVNKKELVELGAVVRTAWKGRQRREDEERRSGQKHLL